MIRAVLDTNVLVSALWCKDGNPAAIVRMMLQQAITPCFDHRIMEEYIDVLNRDRLSFDPSDIREILDAIAKGGISVVVNQGEVDSNIVFADEDGRAFYEVAKFCDATLVTGNKRHYPQESSILTPVEFCGLHNIR